LLAYYNYIPIGCSRQLAFGADGRSRAALSAP
jgi:hypothetical protein